MFDYHQILHDSQTAWKSCLDVRCLTTIRYYTTLKRQYMTVAATFGLTTIRYYTTLKQIECKALRLTGLTTIRYYTTLKLVYSNFLQVGV